MNYTDFISGEIKSVQDQLAVEYGQAVGLDDVDGYLGNCHIPSYATLAY